jgi:hypothetical protein
MGVEAIRRRRLAMEWRHEAAAANMWERDGLAEDIERWCRENLGERHVAWTYRGGGRWAFPDQGSAAWFAMVWG